MCAALIVSRMRIRTASRYRPIIWTRLLLPFCSSCPCRESRAASLKSNGQFEACHFQPDTDLPRKSKVSNQNKRCATSVLRLAIFYACISLRVAPLHSDLVSGLFVNIIIVSTLQMSYQKPDEKRIQTLRDIANKMRIHSVNMTQASNSG